MEASRHDERAIAFFGAWTVFGLYLDGWSHLHHKPETFFTPFHAVLYSGFTAGVIYFAVRGFITRNRTTLDAVSNAGFVLFVIGAVGDFVWHTVFGIEVDLAALLSPTHLMLMIGGLLLLSYPIRSAMRRNEGREITWSQYAAPFAGLTLCGLVLRFFTQFLPVYRVNGLYVSPAGIRDFWEVHVFTAVMVTNAVLVAIVLFAVRRWQPPFGAFTASFGVIAFAERALDGPAIAPAVLGGLVGGSLVDGLVALLKPSPERRREGIALGALAPLLIWVAWFGSLLLDKGVHWPAELPAGTVIFAMLSGAALALLAFPAQPTTAPPPAPPAVAAREPVEL